MLRRETKLPNRQLKTQSYETAALAKERRRDVLANKRVRGVARNLQLPFVPPEDWHEPRENAQGYRVIEQTPGAGFRHILSEADVRARLADFPDEVIRQLDVVQFSRMTRKKQSFPCYGMQWGSSLYLYPIEDNLIEYYHCPPRPSQVNEARMYGGRWIQREKYLWALEWTEESVHDFYLNNILIHELGHIVDSRNTSYVDRERYAEWFALEYGYKKSRAQRPAKAITRRHHKRAEGRKLA